MFHVQNTSKNAIFHEYPNDCKSEGVCSFEQLWASVINNPFITTAFCFLTEQMDEWRDASVTVAYRHLQVYKYHFVLPSIIVALLYWYLIEW